MTGLKLYRVEPHFSGTDADGWGHSIPGSIMTVGASDPGSAARQVSHAAFNLVGHGWRVKHAYLVVHEVTGYGPSCGILTDKPPTWVRVTYWRSGIETLHGDTYAEVKHNPAEYGEVVRFDER